MKLDRTIFSSSKLSDFKTEISKYSLHSSDEKKEAFIYLQSVAYNFPINNPPKMDKTIFSVRKHNG